ncbi:MAG: PilZ domain-containing protein [Desulfofustis sp.]|nr:PilZ domain-containing protein [Desulfofustis sp.]
MSQGEKRKFIRWDAIHLLDYIVIDPDGSEGRYSMGRTLDVSLNGLKLETSYDIPLGAELEITVGIEEDLVDLVGRITHKSEKAGRCISGIEFIKMSAESRRVFRLYTEAFKKYQEQESGAAENFTGGIQ